MRHLYKLGTAEDQVQSLAIVHHISYNILVRKLLDSLVTKNIRRIWKIFNVSENDIVEDYEYYTPRTFKDWEHLNRTN